MRSRASIDARSSADPRDLGGECSDLARRRTVRVEVGDQPACARGVGEGDSLADARREDRRLVIGHASSVSRAMTVRAAHRLSTKRATSCGRKIRASSSSFSISPDAQPSNGEGVAGMRTKSAASSAERISPATRGGPSMTMWSASAGELGQLRDEACRAPGRGRRTASVALPCALLGPIERRALRVGVDEGDAPALNGPRAGEMKRQRRLADAALLVEERDDHDAPRGPGVGRCFPAISPVGALFTAGAAEADRQLES